MNEIATKEQAPVGVGLTSAESYALAKNIAKDLAASDLVPQRYKGNPPNCLIAINMAARIGADPLMVMQNLYVVHGTPGWSSQFLIATFNNNPKFSSLRYEFTGEEGTDTWGCRAWAVEKGTDTRLDGSLVTIDIAKKEGWYSKNGSKWQTMPQQMLMYRAAAWFIRAYAPELAMGLHTAEEVRDIDMVPDESGAYSVDALNAKVMGQEPEPGQHDGTDAEDGEYIEPTDTVTCPISGAVQPRSECEGCKEVGNCPELNDKAA